MVRWHTKVFTIRNLDVDNTFNNGTKQKIQTASQTGGMFNELENVVGKASDSELLPWGYDIFRCDRKTLGNCGDTIPGGGVLLATRCDFGCKPVDLTKNNNLEISAIEINTGNSGKVLVAVIYRPPNANTNWIYDFVQLLNECSYDKLILLGDCNFPAITWIDGSGFCDSSDSALFMFCQYSYDVKLVGIHHILKFF